jgi:hypothetical protein
MSTVVIVTPSLGLYCKIQHFFCFFFGRSCSKTTIKHKIKTCKVHIIQNHQLLWDLNLWFSCCCLADHKLSINLNPGSLEIILAPQLKLPRNLSTIMKTRALFK